MKILYEALQVRRLVRVFSGSTCHFVDFAVHQLIYSCDARRFKRRLWYTSFYQGWITHKARKIILVFKPNFRAYPSLYLIQLRDYGQDTIFVKGKWCINQESKSCPSYSQHIFLDKIHIFMMFHHHIPYGSKAVAYKQHFAKADNSTVKNQGLSFLFIPHCLDEIYLSRIFP